MEKQSTRKPTWEQQIPGNDHFREEVVCQEMVNTTILNAAHTRIEEMTTWLALSLGEDAAGSLIDDLFDLTTEIANVAVTAGIAVERTRALAERDPRVDVLAKPDCDRWLRLALAESGQEPVNPKSLIPAE